MWPFICCHAHSSWHFTLQPQLTFLHTKCWRTRSCPLYFVQGTTESTSSLKKKTYSYIQWSFSPWKPINAPHLSSIRRHCQMHYICHLPLAQDIYQWSLLNGLCRLTPFNLVVLLLSKLTGTQLRMDPEEQHRDLMIQEDFGGESGTRRENSCMVKLSEDRRIRQQEREKDRENYLKPRPCWLKTSFSTMNRDQ